MTWQYETDQRDFVIVSSGPEMGILAEAVRGQLSYRCQMEFQHYRLKQGLFKNGEACPQLPETVRRQHVFFFHPLQFPSPNDALMNLFIANDAIARAAAMSIVLVVPYISYLRQDRKDRPRVPITARLVADLIETNRIVRHVITMDMHTEQAEGFFSIPVDNLSSRRLFAEKVRDLLGNAVREAVVVSADVGGVKRARKFADDLGGLPIAIIDKRRTGPNESEVMHVVGEPVKGRVCLLYDDIFDTGGTTCQATQALLSPPHHATAVYQMATHGIFSDNAEDRFRDVGMPVFVTNTIPRSPEYLSQNPWLSVVSIDQLLTTVLYEHMLRGGSVSKHTW